LRYAIDVPQNVNEIVVFNTWMWSSEGEPEYASYCCTYTPLVKDSSCF